VYSQIASSGAIIGTVIEKVPKMIKSIHFQNFKALREATLPLGPFTLIVGPNGSGKSTAMEAFDFVLRRRSYDFDKILTAGLDQSSQEVQVDITWVEDGGEFGVGAALKRNNDKKLVAPSRKPRVIREEDQSLEDSLTHALSNFRLYSFDAKNIARPAQIDTEPELSENGSGLANVLDDLSGQEPERFDALNKELNRWLPEFDRILFERPSNGTKAFQLRTASGSYKYGASDLSQGTLFAVAILTLAYMRKPPAIVCFEEPDHGIHPRLLMDIRDAMYRLAFPEDYGEERPPVQVIATTHSPYLLDLYKEHPEQIVIVHKDEEGGHFQRLSEKPHITELLEGAPLGDIWFSGILGGVPASP
jgi:predicted ATPase